VTPTPIVAAADGSSLSNPGPAGWAWYVDPQHWAAGGWPHGTNNQGELMAVLNLLEQTAGAEQPLHVLCDSQYVINICTKWIAGWKRRGWRKADKKPILNLELVQALDLALQGRPVTFEWVKGHAGHPLNEQADRLARGAAEAFQQGRPPVTGPGFGLAQTPIRQVAEPFSQPSSPASPNVPLW
jgi:ribonuclease HI